MNLEKRKSVSGFLADFPYVNGGLFKEELKIPKFNSKSHKIIIECGYLNWALINPDIFGSMIQSVANPEIRSDMGMHYTSVVNIMKVIEPLFLNDLKKELKAAGTNKKKLKSLLNRLYHLRIFDPACGSGNFLIIAYKELCAIEIEIYKALYDEQMSFRLESGIKTSQFFGIEINDFACETAKLSLWLAEHQMNLKFEEVFGETKPSLPLEDGGNIFCGNATKLDWEEVCPKDDGTEIYILGNPPYAGSTGQNAEQKNDLKKIANLKIKNYKKLDYVSCWFIKSVEYMGLNTNILVGFVSTNSICQGLQVGILWPYLQRQGVEIFFAHQSFKWTNNTRSNAGVSCIIVGIKNTDLKQGKTLYKDNIMTTPNNINAYLISAPDFFIEKKRKSLAKLPIMNSGNRLVYGKPLFLSTAEKNKMLISYPESEQYIKKVFGANEFINDIERWCLWIHDKDLDSALKIPEIKNRVKNTKILRQNNQCKEASELAMYPHRFQTMMSDKKLLIIPKVSSERRKYIPIGFLDKDAVISDKAFAIYNPPTYIFSIVSSRMHMTWVRTVAGRLKTDYSYSSDLCYNTFPFPEINDEQKTILTDCAFKILDEREKHSEKNLAVLYDPDKMPSGLKNAHRELDLIVESCYRKKPFKSDDECLEYLFKLYEQLIEKDKDL